MVRMIELAVERAVECEFREYVSGSPSETSRSCWAKYSYAERGVRYTLRTEDDRADLLQKGRWRKLRGFATVRLPDGTIHRAELHWYEAHGIGRRETKLKLPLLD